MIKYWQSMQDYKYFLIKSKVHFSFSESNRLHMELCKAWHKHRISILIRPWSFSSPFTPPLAVLLILFYFLCSACLAKPFLTLWADRLRDERVLAALIGYAQDSLPPLGFCFDFLWTDSGLHRKQSYMPGINCVPLPETTKGLISLKGKS